MNNDYDVNYDTEVDYTFNIAERTIPDYKLASSISEWLVSNLESLTDDDNHTLFNKVNTGFNESTLKTFGKKPVCDVYIDRVEYDANFDYDTPQQVHTFVLAYLKGANNHTYMKACELHDYLMQEFIENESFKRLDNYVRDTFITNSEIRVQPVNRNWGIIVAFELTHQLY